jgi:hypothetical protein
MAYDSKKLYEQAETAKQIGLREGFANIRDKFKNEKQFDIDLLPKIPDLIKTMYGLTVTDIIPQKYFSLNEIGYYSIKPDFFVETKEKQNIVIESKNPIHEKSEIISSISQLMSYEFLLEKHGIKAKYVLATSVFDFKYIEFMVRFGIKYDLILNNKNHNAFWINEFV